MWRIGLAGQGIAFSLEDAQGRTLLANAIHTPTTGFDSPTGALFSLPLSDGRLLRLVAPFDAPARPAPEREAHYRLLADHSSDLIVAVDANLRIRYASPQPAPCWTGRPKPWPPHAGRVAGAR